MKWLLAHILMLVGAGIFVQACAPSLVGPSLTPAEFNRRVVDTSTGSGVPDAYVGLKWVHYEETYVHGRRGSCAHVEVVRSGPDGRYPLPTWRGAAPGAIVPYKAGYTWTPDSVAMKNGLETMNPFSGSVAERFDQLERTLSPLNCSEEESKNFVSLLRAMHEEATSIARTEAEVIRAERYQAHLESALYGHEEARKRATNRDVLRASKGTQR